jgi:hypothetical protein
MSLIFPFPPFPPFISMIHTIHYLPLKMPRIKHMVYNRIKIELILQEDKCMGILTTKVKTTFVGCSGEFIGAKGRFACTAIYDYGLLTIIENTEWIKLRINRKDLVQVTDWAIKGNGSLYVDINKQGEGYIYKEDQAD